MTMMAAFLMPKATAMAGDINGAEQGILDALSNTYEYDGGYYKVTDGYIAQVSDYLCKDEVNLTSEEASGYLAQFYANIGTGIASGYMADHRQYNRLDTVRESGILCDKDGSSDVCLGRRKSGCACRGI